MTEQRITDFRIARDAPGGHAVAPLSPDGWGIPPRPPASAPIWHVHHDGVTRFMNDAGVRSAVMAGSLPPTALGWREGMAGWLPLSEAFAAPPPPPPRRPVPARADRHPLIPAVSPTCATRPGDCGRIGSAVGPGAVRTCGDGVAAGAVRPSPAAIAGSRPAVSLLSLLMAVIGLVTADYLLVAVFDLTELLQGRLGVGAAVTVRAAALVSIALLGAGVTIAAWRHPLRRSAGAAAGLVLTFAAAATVFQGANAAGFVIAGRDIHAMTLAMDGSPDAELTALGDGVVRISGELGPNLLQDFMALEAAEGPFRTIEINSHGGFVDGALAIAATVDARRLTVVVRDECLSACVLIAVASPKALAYEDAQFGFHRSTPVVEYTSDLMRYSAEQVDADVRQHLSTHGVPEDMLEQAWKHGPETMHFVDAREMFRRGIIEGVMPAGETAGSGM